jgi:hypothetical protein
MLTEDLGKYYTKLKRKDPVKPKDNKPIKNIFNFIDQQQES